MSNMSYCRFENTVSDLLDCSEALSEMGDDLAGTNSYDEKLSEYEYPKAKALIELCRDIAERFEDVDLNSFDEDWEGEDE